MAPRQKTSFAVALKQSFGSVAEIELESGAAPLSSTPAKSSAASAKAKPEVVTPPKPAAKGRPKKGASKAPDAAEEPVKKRGQEKEEEAADPPKKRGRKAKEASQVPGEEAGADSQQSATPARRPPREKGTPLPRSVTPRAPKPPVGSRVLKLVSVNVAGLRAVLNGEKAETLRALVAKELPDILCINEHKLKTEDVAEAEAQMKELLPSGYDTAHWAVSTAKKGYSGVAAFLKTTVPAAEVSFTEGMGAQHEEDPILSQEGRVLTIDLPELLVVSTYAPNSGTELQRLSNRVGGEGVPSCWDRALSAYVKSLQKEKGKPVVVLGDLNCAHRVQDIWNMHDRPDFPEGLAAKPLAEQYVGLKALLKFAGLTPEERESFPRMLADADLVDTFRAIHPQASGVFSYFSQRAIQNRPMNQGLRLDYALASASMCRQLKPASESDGQGPTKEGAETSSAQVGDSSSEVLSPQVLDSYILDEGDLVADHAAICCTILLPNPTPAA